MSVETVVARFAPSPTGQLHLGNARTALFNYLLARSHHGRFLLRIEDTDTGRSSEAFVAALYADLQWLGLSWDEGPDRGGAAGPYRQSERGAIYAAYFERLERAGAAYPCFCTPAELELSRRAQLAAGRPPRYAGTCRELTAPERAARAAAGVRPSLRFRVPPGRRIAFEDLVHGAQSFASDDIGDFIIRREDGAAAFLFANAVDDALMGVTQVLRGADHLANTPRQRLLLDALALRAPQYGHVSLLLGPDGAPLSKRHGALGVRELREAGYSSVALCNQLFRLGHSAGGDALLDPEEMIRRFDVGHLQRANAHYELEQLRHWQAEWVRSLAPEALHAWLAPHLPPALAAGRVDAFLAAVRPNLVLPADLAPWLPVAFGGALEYEAAAVQAAQEAGPQFFATAAALLGEAPGGAGAALAELGRATGRRGAALYTPLRAALTGRLHGPQLAPLLALMPAGAARERLLHFAGAAH